MIPFYQVDAFTSEPFHGNTAGVVLLEKDLPDWLMTQIARQNNLPATAFVRLEAKRFSIRWFTPANELPLCGHATLASAHILFSTGLANQNLRFTFKNGTLTVRQRKQWIEMDFPAFSAQITDLPAGLASLFGLSLVSAALTQNRYLVEVADENFVRTFQPDGFALSNYRLILTAKSNADAPYDFVSRYFAAPDGVFEDAVTGSSHCSLVPWWAHRLNKSEFRARQVSPRGGDLKLALIPGGVTISGQAVKVMEGKLLI